MWNWKLCFPSLINKNSESDHLGLDDLLSSAPRPHRMHSHFFFSACLVPLTLYYGLSHAHLKNGLHNLNIMVFHFLLKSNQFTQTSQQSMYAKSKVKQMFYFGFLLHIWPWAIYKEQKFIWFFVLVTEWFNIRQLHLQIASAASRCGDMDGQMRAHMALEYKGKTWFF